MPWSAKAQELLRTQYAAVGAAGSASLPRAARALEETRARLDGEDRVKIAEVEARFRLREQDIDRFVTAYRQYCWTVDSLTDLKLAPFHLLATEGHVHTDKDHLWHMNTLAEVCLADAEILLATKVQSRGRDRPGEPGGSDRPGGTSYTGRGGEGMVVKPLAFVHKGRRGLSQPAVKCRGREYLRIIYGPDYTCGRTWIAYGHEGWAASGPWPSASLPWASKGWSDLCVASRCVESTSAFSAFWPWRASPLIQGCRKPKSQRRPNR